MRQYKNERVELSTPEKKTLKNALSILEKIDNLLQEKDLDGVIMEDDEQELINDLSRYASSVYEFIDTDD